jgi:Uma2 family endonuclease
MMAYTNISDADIEYPDSDGQPMSDNTKQFRWITIIKGGLDAVFRNDPHVFVAGDLLWYPVRGDNRTRLAPDAMVALGRPKGDRGSYKQWMEGNQPPDVVFEVLSPGNTAEEMERKRQWYERYGVQEYYLYDPDNPAFFGWHRIGNALLPLRNAVGTTSPLLGVRFDWDTSQDELALIGPDGRRFNDYAEVVAELEQAQSDLLNEQVQRARTERELSIARAERDAMEAERERIEQERNAANVERERIERERDAEKLERERIEQERDAQRLALEQLRAKLREMGIDPDALN